MIKYIKCHKKKSQLEKRVEFLEERWKEQKEAEISTLKGRLRKIEINPYGSYDPSLSIRDNWIKTTGQYPL